uniref:Uncharacterized protein n=1 Tax=Lotharella oceanica TaxID=641309 RepID=A0A7S2TN61_9EUKA|mmetsp:Transcript_1949/g.3686  ORF Transcript_1949/g.3686 Transcript_1949/m.3686 type:complete len:320 (+) Transcript_1949:104-1063(+)|eukprot:CAMPEP_0170172742 /NCGR_PEP_ID=MMETSP0040_2-20121228/6003_1 /TAXON_ID=641309 /ORGANISM="Lotharella oceanica, Strain CCMP622" /LENGTH=319 /DNA_ID=CAMNT_0010413557 /DNA_START=74 /DNA_END=1033 /DNA_ORIENTATION=-
MDLDAGNPSGQPEPQKKNEIELQVEEEDGKREEVKANRPVLMWKIMNITHLALLGLTLIFVVPLLASHDGQVAWSTGKDTVDGNTITGWSGLLYHRDFRSRTKGLITLVEYDSDQCEGFVEDNTCKKCDAAGNAVLSFVVLAFFLLIVSWSIVGLRLSGLSNKGWYKILASRLVAAMINGTITLFYLFQWTIWAAECNAHLQDDDVIKDFDAALGPAWALAFLSFIAMACVTAIDGLLFVMGERDGSSARSNVRAGPSNAKGYGVQGKTKGGHSAVPLDAAKEDQAPVAHPVVVAAGQELAATDGRMQVPSESVKREED